MENNVIEKACRDAFSSCSTSILDKGSFDAGFYEAVLWLFPIIGASKLLLEDKKKDADFVFGYGIRPRLEIDSLLEKVSSIIESSMDQQER